MRLSARLVPVAQVDATDRDAMFDLMDRHYEGARRQTFERDLAGKHWVIQIRRPGDGRLCGFSTQVIEQVEAAGRTVRVLFSGDTIIDRDHWGDPALTHVWGRLVLSLLDAYPGAEWFWFLISKGYKTYRFLPVFFHEFYPRHDVPTPPRLRGLIDLLARRRFPDDYDAAAGVVRTGPQQYRLRAGVADVTAERLNDPHVRFFEASNPGHQHGDELCCLAPLSRENFTRAAYRVIGPEPVALEVG